MKKIVTAILLIALLAVGVSALQVSSPKFGDKSADRADSLSGTITITNNEASDLSSIVVTVTGDSKFKLVVDQTTVPATISAGQTGTFKLSAFIPLDLDAVDATTLKEKVHDVGTITVTAKNSSGSNFNAVSNVTMQAINQLELDKVKVACDTSSRTLDDGDTFKNLKPGETCSMDIDVNNNFDDNDRDDRKIGDIEFDNVRIIVDASNNDVDVDVDDDISSLGADSDDTAVVDIEIEDDADDRKVSLDIRIFGRDDNGALHGEEISVKLDIERLSKDIQLRTVQLSPSRVANCDDSSVKASVQILNQGRRDEREAAVEVSVDSLKFSEKRQDIDLDRDDTQSAVFDILVPKGTKAGVIDVDFRTFFDNVAPSNQGSVQLVVEECDVEEEPQVTVVSSPSSGTTTIVVPTKATTAPATSTATTSTATAAPRKTGFTGSPAYVALLVIGIVMVIMLIAGLVVMLVRKQQ